MIIRGCVELTSDKFRIIPPRLATKSESTVYGIFTDVRIEMPSATRTPR